MYAHHYFAATYYAPRYYAPAAAGGGGGGGSTGFLGGQGILHMFAVTVRKKYIYRRVMSILLTIFP